MVKKSALLTPVLGLILMIMISGRPALAGAYYQNLAYGSKERNHLDIYLPGSLENPPVVLFIHGGRWFRNDKSQVHLYDRVRALNDAGIAVISMNYTYSTQSCWPAQKEDLHAALTFISENGSTYGYDASRMAVWGQSSGAHLTLWAALLGCRDPKIHISAVVAWYAPSDLFRLKDDIKAEIPAAQAFSYPDPAPEDILIGSKVAENQPASDGASPGPQMGKLPKEIPLPSILLMHGTADSIVSPRQSRRLHDLLRQRGADAALVLVKGAGHGGEGWQPMVKRVVDFLRPCLGTNKPRG